MVKKKTEEIRVQSDFTSSDMTDEELLDYLLKCAPDDKRIPMLKDRV